MESKTRIIQIANSFGIGGRENVILNLCNNLSTEKFDIHLVLLSNDNNVQINKLHAHVKVHALPFSESSFKGIKILIVFLPLLVLLTKKINQINPQIIHSHALFVWLIVICLSVKFSKAKISHFHTIHTSGLYYANKGIVNWLRLNSEKLALKLNDSKLIAISKSIKLNLNKHFNNKIVLIYNGIDLSKIVSYNNPEIEKIINERISVTYLSRLDVGKNHLLLLQAWKEVVEVNKNIVLLLVGDGPQRQAIEEYIKKNNLLNSVVVLGNRNDALNILSYTKIAVFPSLFEGFPIALLEKMLMKLPIIVSDIDIFQELITDNENGLIFEKNSANDLSSKIIILINNNDFRQKIATSGYNSVQKYSTKNMIKGYENLFLERK